MSDREDKGGPTSRPDRIDYEVGYGRPPIHTRFRKGQSGNPKGRPRKAKSVKVILEEALTAPITITEGGKTKTIDHRAALLKSLLTRAIKGDNRASSLVIKLMEQTDLGPSTDDSSRITEIRSIIVDPRAQDEEKD